NLSTLEFESWLTGVAQWLPRNPVAENEQTVEDLDQELKLLLRVSRALPKIRGAGRIAVAIQKFYQRKKRNPLTVPVLNFLMHLDPHELVEVALLFYPQLYDHREIAILRRELRHGDTFLDLGSNAGFYSLVASSLVGPSGKVVSVEADPEMFENFNR